MSSFDIPTRLDVVCVVTGVRGGGGGDNAGEIRPGVVAADNNGRLAELALAVLSRGTDCGTVIDSPKPPQESSSEYDQTIIV